MAHLTKYRPAGEVMAAKATERNLGDLAELAGGQTFTSPAGDRYALLETPRGTARLGVGDYLVQSGDGKDAAYNAVSGDEFDASFTK